MNFIYREQSYHQLPLDEEGRKSEGHTGEEKADSIWNSTSFTCLRCFLALLLVVLLGTLYLRPGLHNAPLPEQSNPFTTSCERPEIRKEWRSLTSIQQNDYLSAVTCLATKPSRLGLNQTLHDDFAYVHIWFGHDGHDGVSFFAYHRWFLHLYERALRDECQYNGNMIYWDWSLDWKAPYESPIFNTRLGFGGEGSGRTADAIRGSCVEAGPLPNHTIPFFETTETAHCLSREFLANKTDLTYWSSMWDPEYLEIILNADDFQTFVDLVEEGPHLSLPHMLHGDFSSRGAPVDPIFMLHHGNLDRLYWEWQKRKPERRLVEYKGRKTGQDMKGIASLENMLVFGDLGRSVKVREVMRTEGEALCYRYPD